MRIIEREKFFFQKRSEKIKKKNLEFVDLLVIFQLSEKPSSKWMDSFSQTFPPFFQYPFQVDGDKISLVIRNVHGQEKVRVYKLVKKLRSKLNNFFEKIETRFEDLEEENVENGRDQERNPKIPNGF